MCVVMVVMAVEVGIKDDRRWDQQVRWSLEGREICDQAASEQRSEVVAINRSWIVGA